MAGVTSMAQNAFGTCEINIGKVIGIVVAPVLVLCCCVLLCISRSSSKNTDDGAPATMPVPALAPAAAPVLATMATPASPVAGASTEHIFVSIPATGLEAELQHLKLPALRERAAAAGVSAETIEEARDSDEPKPTLIKLIVDADNAAKLAAAREGAAQRARTAELAHLKLPDLRKRAAAAGATEDDIEDARDSDNPKEALMELILAQQEKSAATTAEFEGLTLKELRQRAIEAGVDADDIEDARDADEPKEAMIALLLAKAAAAQP